MVEAEKEAGPVDSDASPNQKGPDHSRHGSFLQGTCKGSHRGSRVFHVGIKFVARVFVVSPSVIAVV